MSSPFHRMDRTHTSPAVSYSAYYYLFAAIALLMAVFFFTRPVSAQTEEAPVVSAEAQEVVPVEAPVAAVEAEVAVETETASEEAILDADVHVEELGVSKSTTILQDSPLYGFKRFFRKTQEVFTFDSAKKIERQIENANKELGEAKLLAERKPEEGQAIAEAAHRVSAEFADIKDRAEGVKDHERSGEVLERVLDAQLKHQKVFERIEEQVGDHAPAESRAEVFAALGEARQSSAESTGEFVSVVETDPTLLGGHFDNVLAAQTGSEFKDIKNLEVLKRVESFVPDQAKKAIQHAQENAFKRMSDEFGKLDSGTRGKKFERYTQFMPGDETAQMELWDQMKIGGALPEDMAQKMDSAKDFAAKRFQDRLGKMDQVFGGNIEIADQFRERAFDRFTQGSPDVERLRALQEMKKRIEVEEKELGGKIKEQMGRVHEESLAKFGQIFTDSQSQDEAKQAAILMKKMMDNPDPTTFQMIEDMKQQVMKDPKKREFMEKMDQGAKAQFVALAAEQGDQFYKRYTTDDPRDIAIFDRLQKDFETQGAAGFAPPTEFFQNFQFEGFEGVNPFFLPPGQEGQDFGPSPFGGPQGGFPSFPPSGNFSQFFDQAKQQSLQNVTNHAESIHDPAQFQNFQLRFQQADQNIVNQFQQFGNFKDIFNQKSSEIQDQVIKQQAQIFQQQFQGQQGGPEGSLNEEAFKQQFKQQLEKIAPDGFNPFCDDACKAGQQKNFQKQLEQQSGQQFQQFQQNFVQQQQRRGQQGFPQQPSFGQPGQDGQPSFPPGFVPGREGQFGQFDQQGTSEDHDNSGPQGQPFEGRQFSPPGSPQGQPFGTDGQFTPPKQPFGGQGQGGPQGQQKPSFNFGPKPPSFQPPTFQKPFNDSNDSSGKIPEFSKPEFQKPSEEFKDQFKFPFESAKPSVFDTKTGEAIQFPPQTESTPKPGDTSGPTFPQQPSVQPLNNQPVNNQPGSFQPVQPFNQPTNQPTQPITQPQQPVFNEPKPFESAQPFVPPSQPTPSFQQPSFSPPSEPTPAPSFSPPPSEPAPSFSPPPSGGGGGFTPQSVSGNSLFEDFISDMGKSFTLVGNLFTFSAKAMGEIFLR